MPEEKRLTSRDHERVKHLSEEARRLLMEASSIAAKQLGYTEQVKEVRFAKESEGQGLMPEWPDEVAVFGNRIYFVTPRGCGYYDVEAGVCAAGPCW